MKLYELKDYKKPYQNIYDTLMDSAKKYPKKIAVIDDNSEITYQELLERVDELAGVLKYKYHLKEQDQIGFLMVNSIDMVTAFYASMKIGCITVMINTKLQEEQIYYLLESTEPKLIFSDSRWLDKIENVAAKLGNIKICTELTNFDRKNLQVITQCVRNLNNTAVIMHTSGTTGPPKGVMITHRNILETAYGYQEVQGLDDKALTVLSVPLFHILGLSCVMTHFIYLGGTIVLSAFYNVQDVLMKIKKYKATHFHSVPTIFLQLIKCTDEDKDLSSLEVAVSGGAPISKENIEAFCNLAPNAKFHLAYGMTETAGSGTLSYVHKGHLKALPNVHVTVVSSNYEEVEPGQLGEIVFCGPVVAQGRWNAPSLPEPHMYSGDLGYMDIEGNVYVLDRVKDMINRGGEKIFPSLIENVLLEYPGIVQAAVYAVSNEEYGELPAAAIVVEKDREVDITDVHHFLRKKIAKFECPSFIDIMEALPLTQNGKIRKTELRKKAQERRVKNI